MKNITSIRLIALVLSLILTLGCVSVSASESSGGAVGANASLDLACKSAILMEASTGRVLYEQNADEPLPPASVTKIMTLLIVMEAIDSGVLKLDDQVSVSRNAASMGGSQVFLEEGETMSVEDMLKSVIISSANDAAVALAEQVAGSEEAFVQKMNARASELGMKNTCFENTNGLDDTTQNHLTSAMDIAIMSRELIKHKKITEYSSIWMDTIRNGAFGLTNTNRLVKYYEGATGLKTGSTSKAGFCVSATATRNGMTLIAVVMGSSSRDARNSAAVALLNYGFSNFALFRNQPYCGSMTVVKGKLSECEIREDQLLTVVNKKELSKITKEITLDREIAAPIKKGTQVGTATYTVDGKAIGSSKITVVNNVERISFVDLVIKMLSKICFC